MPTLNALRQTLFAAGQAGADALLRHAGKIRNYVKKGEVDLVTVADEEAETAVIQTIQRAFPDHAILAEESGLSEKSASPYRWVIDPLDGTMNFTHSVPIFSVSIALEKDGETLMGLVVDPSRDEWFFARRGGGAFCNKKRLRVSPTAKLADSYVITGFPHNRRAILAQLLQTLETVILETHGMLRLGSAALDLCYVAAGRGDAFYEPFLKPWDIAAGKLIVQEAGGKVTSFRGRSHRLGQTDILATNGRVHGELQKILKAQWSAEALRQQSNP